MRVIRIAALAFALFATAGVSSAAATSWSTVRLGYSVWFGGSTNWDNDVLLAGGLGSIGPNYYGPIASTPSSRPCLAQSS